MIPILLVALPTFLGIVTLLIRGEKRRKIRRLFLILGALAHAAGTGWLHIRPEEKSLMGLIEVDPLGLLFLTITSLLFLISSIYSLGYFQHERTKYTEEGVSHLYVPCMLFFLASMTLTTFASQLGILWIAIEATTIASAPLIYYHHHHQALEAAWKYLLICSVGIAIALLGIFFVAASAKGNVADLSLSTMIASARSLDARWFRAGFLLILVGFGTKMGLAPLHSWLPDAHSEAPSPVSALLSGALLNCAFLGILRFYQILIAAGLADFAGRALTLLGLSSLFIATVFITGQRDYKRLLAYSSVEHMGIMALGLGWGAKFGVLLHAVNHSLTKGLLFLVAGQILIAYRTKNCSEVQGLIRTIPATGLLFLVGIFAIIGSPPFGPFVSEFLILREGLGRGHPVGSFLYLLFLGVIFISMSRIVLGMIQGEKRDILPGEAPSRLMVFPPVVLAVAVFLFGLYIPESMVSFLKTASQLIGGGS
ncbi:MAG: NADH dehydrogenase FAD-containing subunit [Deltaproteobacteria bacterium]|nr:NADH dehydrogenase FAD-containing subunit [Deltaproteobacteria bacterium]